MKRARPTPDEFPGLTIESVHGIDDHLVLIFTDGTYAALATWGDCRMAAECCELDESPCLGYIAKNYVKAGIWTVDEYAAWEAPRKREEQYREQEQERRELAEYARLKSKYGV